MGPRSYERGNIKPPDRVTPNSQLQWGRVLMNAEICGVSKYRLCATWLQWGRVLMNAEIIFSRSRFTIWLMLQWGRVLMNAEIPKIPTPDHGRRAASMGPRSYERGNKASTAARRCRGDASMGPRSYERGNRLCNVPT